MCKDKSQILDELLILQARDGDREAFAQLVVKWNKKLTYQSHIRTNNWQESQDIVQDVWHWLVTHLHKLDDVSSFGPWIRTIVDRRSIDWLRKQKRNREIIEKFDGSDRHNHIDTNNDPDTSKVDVEQTLTDLEQAIGDLDPEAKLVLTLYYIESNSLDSISKILEVPKGTVKSRLFYAREKLKKTFKHNEDEKPK